MDSGDEPTYLVNAPAPHPVDPLKDDVGGTFHGGVFNSAPVGEVWHKGHEDGGTKHSSTWLHGVSLASDVVLCFSVKGLS